MYERIEFDAPELRTLVSSFTSGLDVHVMPGNTRFSEATIQGFQHINPDGMFMLFMSVHQMYMRNQLARKVSSLLFPPAPRYSIRVNDLVMPEESRFYSIDPVGERVIVIQDEQKPRTMNEQDIDTINRVLSTLDGSRKRDL